ncbi:X-linked retinitis pigmentosa GTPase regulator [Holothuria leucospilota]|uniref:X-linked retinitis pigmentosa GTPase regulator n=1 Tax=Holothuria leucospilota TaxID=206669 RepID=A0A9Q0YTP0_HOLLE|nr:X-linked retinitis pigmentosa GTPase regulator [Holothuria leucospilota]
MTLEDEDIPETGAVFTFGKSRFADNTPNKFWIRNDKVVHVSCGDDHSAFVTENGRLYTFGANEWGQLGLGSSKSTTKPSSVKALKQEGVKSVSCGRLHTIALSKAGKLYTFGAGGEGQLGLGDSDGSEVPKQVQSLDCYTVAQMSCGTDHSFILTDAGVLLAWGGGAEGQLGMDDTMESNIPRELPFRSKVKQVSCGYYHTAFVTEEGNLFTFGENDLGKLGLGDNFTGSTNIPTHVSDIETPVQYVACGNNHTAAIAGDKDVYTFGEGSQGQLGLGPSLLQVSTPHLVTKLKKHRCKMISCGESHTAVITESASLYTFGDGRHGKLAQGEESFSNLFVPTRVKRFKGFYVEQVSCGGCHTLVRARKKHPSQGEMSSDSETENEEQVLRHSGNFEGDASSKELGENLKKLADSIELQGSLNGSLGGTARGRRRQRETSPLPPLARTLPPLSTSTPKSLPTLGARTMGDNSLNQQKIPSIPADFPEDYHMLVEWKVVMIIYILYEDSNQNSTIKKEDVTKDQESDDDDDDEDDDEEDDDSDTDEDDDDANTKRAGQDEVDAGTPVDEPLSQTYFSKSGNRSDMKPVASMKHKSKKIEESAVTDQNTASSSKGSSKKTAEDTQKNSAKEVKGNTTKTEAAKVKGIDKEAKSDEEEDEDDEEDDDDDDDEDEDEDDGEDGSEEEEEGKGDEKKNEDKEEATSSKIQKEPEKDSEKGKKEEEIQEMGGGDQGKDVEKKTEKETVTEERKPWQFWKKKELPVKTVNEAQSDIKTDTQTHQGNVNRSKTCIML